MADDNEQKHIWVTNPETTDFKAKAVVVSTIVILGIAAFLSCVYVIIPALLSDMSDFVG